MRNYTRAEHTGNSVDELLFHFLWKNKIDHNSNNGGLNLIDFSSLNDAFKKVE